MSNHDTDSSSGSSVRKRAALRAVFAGIVMLSVSSAVAPPARIDRQAGRQFDHGYVPVADGRRQPTGDDVKDAGQVQPDENALAKKIEEENERVDRLLKGICRGC